MAEKRPTRDLLGFIIKAYLADALDEQVGTHVRHDDLRSTSGYRRRARIGQSRDLPDLDREYGMDVKTILDARAQALLD